MSDVRIKWDVNWILNHFGHSFLLSFGFWAADAGADWVRLSLGKTSDFQWSKFGLSIFGIGKGVFDLTIELWGKVVVNISGWVLPSVVTSWEFPVFSNDFGGNFLIGEGVLDVLVLTEVWNKVVHWVAFYFWVLELSATGGGADWVRFHLGKRFWDVPGTE